MRIITRSRLPEVQEQNIQTYNCIILEKYLISRVALFFKSETLICLSKHQFQSLKFLYLCKNEAFWAFFSCLKA